MPEWYLVLGTLALLSVAGIYVKPLVPWTDAAPVRVELLLLAAAGAALVVKAARTAWLAPNGPPTDGLMVRSLTAMLFLLQPVARLAGRLRRGLTPWRRRGEFVFTVPWPRGRQVWSERWRSPSERLVELERDLRARCMTVLRGGDYDRWDIHVRLGPLGAAGLRMGVEEHGNGRQLVRYRIWPRWSHVLSVIAALLGAWLAASVTHELYLSISIGAVLLLGLLRACAEAGAGVAAILAAIERQARAEEEAPEARDLLDDLRVVPGSRLLESLDGRNGSPGCAAAEAAEAFERRG
jgi:hypothetical protein